MPKIRITLKSDLCAGSGEATGVTVDKDLCIDAYGLPYIPARRLKGCLREAARLLQDYGCKEAGPDNIAALFGTENGGQGVLRVGDACLPGAESMRALLSGGVEEALRVEAEPLNVAKLFTYVRGQTKLENGVAVDGSLRYTRVMAHHNALDERGEAYLDAPIELDTGDLELHTLLELCCRATRHIGSMRNRGLGNVQLSYLRGAAAERPSAKVLCSEGADAADQVEIRYAVSLDAPVTLPGCAEQNLEIPARSVIGCVSAAYLRSGKAEDSAFHDLFLNGKVSWSSLTPSIGGKRSVPAPLMLVFLKNEGSCKNLYAAEESEVLGKKQKTMGGSYAADTGSGFDLASIRRHTLYHYSHRDQGTLYMQDSLDAGMVFRGVVTAPGAMAETVCGLLLKTRFAFGRSKSAQYAACGIYGDIEVFPVEQEPKPVRPGCPIYAVLQSDLVLAGDGTYEVRPDAVRAALSAALNADAGDAPDRDFCEFHVIGGYQQMWQMQKPQIPALRGGSVFCLRAKGTQTPRQVTLGEFGQEGFGVFRIYTGAEMQSRRTVRRAAVDEKEPSAGDGAWQHRLETALTVAACRRAMGEHAMRYYNGKVRGDQRFRSGRAGLIGRLRLMLAEAEDYGDFLARIQSIKDSNVSADNRDSDRKKALDLVYGVCGGETLSAAALTGNDADLAKRIGASAEVEAQVLRLWKEPLRMLLHAAYYDKSGAEAK